MFPFLPECGLSCYNKEADRFGDDQTAYGLEGWQLLHQHGAARQGRATDVQKRLHVQRGESLGYGHTDVFSWSRYRCGHTAREKQQSLPSCLCV